MKINLFLMISFFVASAFGEEFAENFGFLLENGSYFECKYYKLRQLVEEEKEYRSEAPEEGEVPDIYDTMWPFFCLKDLINDPQSCSCWTNEKSPKLEFNKKGNSLAFVDTKLINRIGDKWRYIPTLGEYCDYGKCEKCGDTIIRSYMIDEIYSSKYNEVEEAPYILYRCSCLEPGVWYSTYVGQVEHHLTFGKYCEAFEKKCPHWKFCKQSSFFPGYFNWSYQHYFSFFEQFLGYIEKNRQCSATGPLVCMALNQLV